MAQSTHEWCDDTSDEHRAILAAIERETNAFLCRDFATWAECWLQDQSARRLGACMGGMMDYHEGWDACCDAIRQIMEQHPRPNPEAARRMRRTNLSIRVGGNMAWVSYDQYGERSEDPLVTAGLSHQLRVLEKRGGDWKIAVAGHADTSLEYFDFPVIRVDVKGRIDWMNDAARTELPGHPALTKSGSSLRARHRADDRCLRRALEEVSQLTVMDRRPSISHPHGRLADPVILSGGEADGQYLIWISFQDGMLLVSFRDSMNERNRLERSVELFGLSPAQHELAGLLIEGNDTSSAAQRLGVSISTVKTHLTRMFDKTGARSQPALISKLLSASPPTRM